MIRALRCLGYVLLGIVCTIVALLAVCVFVAGACWLAFFAADWFELSKAYVLPFYVGFIAIFCGAIVGVAMCRESLK